MVGNSNFTSIKGGCRQVFSHAEGGWGTTSFGGSFYTGG